MYVCKGRFCILEELNSNNEEGLFKIMSQHSDEYRQTVSDEPIPSSIDEFREKLRIWFRSGRNYQFLVYSRSQHLSGTIFLYGWDEQRKIVKYSCFFIPNKRKEVVVAEALGLVVSFAFHFMNIKNIYFDVYDDNHEMQRLAHKFGGNELSHRESAVNKNRIIINYLLSGDAIDRLINKLNQLEKR